MAKTLYTLPLVYLSDRVLLPLGASIQYTVADSGVVASSIKGGTGRGSHAGVGGGWEEERLCFVEGFPYDIA